MISDLSGRPLADTSLDRDLFVDREDALRRAISSIQQRSNVIVTGSPGAGKTSFLHRLESELRGHGYEAVYISARPARSAEDLVERLRWRLGTRASAHAQAARPEPPLPGWERLGGSANLSDLIEGLPRQGGDARTVLLVDAPAPDVGHTLWGRLRDELWQLPYTWVVATDEAERVALTAPPADAFFPTEIELEALSHEDARRLLRARIGNAIAPESLDRIVGLAGGNPRRLIAIARDLIVNGRTVADLLAEERRRAQALGRLSEPAGRLFAYLQEHGPASASDDELLIELGWTRPRAAQVFAELEKAGLVRGTRERGGRRRLFEVTQHG